MKDGTQCVVSIPEYAIVLFQLYFLDIPFIYSFPPIMSYFLVLEVLCCNWYTGGYYCQNQEAAAN